MLRRGPAAILFLLCLAGAALAAPARAATVTKTLRAGPYHLDGFQTIRPKVWVQDPDVDGYVTQMNAWLVRRNGRRVPISRVMLHHVVFINVASERSRRLTSCGIRAGQPFYGTGEERQQLFLPPGYGYLVKAADRWRMQTMLMSHGLAGQNVYVEYRMRIVTGRRLTPVTPLWLRANRSCTGFPSYPVAGGGAPGSTDVHSFEWAMPFDGRIVAAGAHLHGSSKDMTISEPSCGDRVLVDHKPRYAAPSDLVYRIRPVLHEPGPVATGYFMSRTGVSVRRGERLRVTGFYDDARPHPQVMAISHVYLAPGRATKRRCAPLPADRRTLWTRHDGSFTPPVVTVPLNGIDANGRIVEIDRPRGATLVAGLSATVDMAGSAYRPANLSVEAGARITWRWRDPIEHNLMLANGPRNLTGPIKRGGFRMTRTLAVPGTYRMFCSLHPVTMQEVIVVRPPGTPAGAAPPSPAPPGGVSPAMAGGGAALALSALARRLRRRRRSAG